jgi:iron complex outermembrane receptor protein
LNYTFLDHRNETDDRPLDAQSKHNLNFNTSFFPLPDLRIGLYGIFGSKSWWYDFFADAVLIMPAYFNMDAIASYSLAGNYEVFVKLGNVFNHSFYTEPGFPWRGRYLEIGFRMDILK